MFRIKNKIWKLWVVFLIIILVLFTSFWLLFYAQKEIYDYMDIYPYIDCDSVTKIYDSSLQHYGVLEWVYLTNTLKSDDLRTSTGILSCLCKNYSDLHGVYDTLVAEFYTKSKVEGEYVGGTVWQNWQSGNLLMNILDYIITFTIVIVDIILRYIVVYLVKWVHFQSFNIEWVVIQTILFVSQYLNNGLSLMLVGINVDEAFGQHIIFMDGKYPDFTNRWFNEIANFFITPMYINIFVPIIEFIIVYTIYCIVRLHDQGWTWNTYNTKWKSMGQYINKMSGSENDIFDRYSFIMMVIFINMFYGVGLPLLFPLTLIALIILYFSERILTCFWYK